MTLHQFHIRISRQIMASLVGMCCITLLEYSRMIQGSEPGRLEVLLFVFLCLLVTTFSLRSRPISTLGKAVTHGLSLLSFLPAAYLCFRWISGELVPPIEKNLMLLIECTILVMSLYAWHMKVRRLCVFLSGIMAIIAWSNIDEMQLPPWLAMLFLIVLIPSSLYLERITMIHQLRKIATEEMIVKKRSYSSSSIFIVPRLAILSFLLVTAAYFIKSDRSIHYVISEWMNSSGGTGQTNELATSGVGDGPNEVSASQNPESVGFTDSEIFLESDRPSLFDAFNEQYGEPFKKQKHERMQAMGPQNMKETSQRPKENLEAGRTFDLQRLQRDTKHQLEDRKATALIYVQGEPKTRLKLISFDRFDGLTWSIEHDCTDRCNFSPETRPGNQCWFCLRYPYPMRELFTETIHEKIKLASLDTSVLPAPANLWKFNVGGIREAEMFGWAGLGVVRIKDRTFPPGTVLQTESYRLSRSRLMKLHSHDMESYSTHGSLFNANDTYQLSQPVRSLLDHWNLGSQKSWLQIERVISALKNHAELENHQISEINQHDSISLENTTDDPITDFLLNRRKGPDYLFASSATVILRSLGYPCRLVSGLYIDPKTYDHQKSHYSLSTENLHFWVEVLLGDSTWVPVDPSPGYEPEYAGESWSDTIYILSMFVAFWLRRHAFMISFCILLMIILVLMRVRLYDKVILLRMKLFSSACDRSRILLTIRFLEWRASRIFGSRPLQFTLLTYFESLPVRLKDQDLLLSLSEWAAYAPLNQGSGLNSTRVRQICRDAVSEMTLSRLRNLKSSKGAPN